MVSNAADKSSRTRITSPWKSSILRISLLTLSRQTLLSGVSFMQIVRKEIVHGSSGNCELEWQLTFQLP